MCQIYNQASHRSFSKWLSIPLKSQRERSDLSHIERFLHVWYADCFVGSASSSPHFKEEENASFKSQTS
ncbi:hypothetical protein K239x_39570 [Planctomycetes bacterium K23_9]|uniref:Uncharacterized protein n=1 Tax=Stieleria marina TaxID=1930275 RepID=A0A517NXU5_9BACT|nr:hypothetical protein K239x_39570 [Planctomycetes bacterium K23_9]